DFLEGAGGEFPDRGNGGGVTQEGFGRHDYEGLAVVALHLAAERVEEVGRGGDVGHLHVVLSAELEETLEAGGGVLGALAFVAVGEQEDHGAHALPFGLGG